MDKKLKIVHIVSSFTSGGAEALVKELAIKQAETEDVEVWAMNPAKDTVFAANYKSQLEKGGVKIEEIGNQAGSERLKRILLIRNLISTKRPDAVNAHSEVHAAFLAAATLGLKVNIYQTVHSTVINFKPVQKYFSNGSLTKYIAISKKCEEIIQDIVNPSKGKIRLIYNGIDLNRFNASSRVTKPAAENIVIIGRLAPEKDHANLFNAYKILKEKLNGSVPLPTLNVIGGGDMRSGLEALAAELGLAENVVFHGVQFDIPKVLLSNDILVMSSKWEGLSIALLEAVASGIPIVATNVGSNHEIVKDGFNGVLVPKEDSAALADAIEKLITDAKRRKEYSDNSKTVAANFDICNTAKSYIQLYKEASLN